jgi:hypothetical protein
VGNTAGETALRQAAAQDRDEGDERAAIAQSLETFRRPEDVFFYATDH